MGIQTTCQLARPKAGLKPAPTIRIADVAKRKCHDSLTAAWVLLEREMDRSALADGAFGPHPAAVTAHDVPDDGQAYPGALELFVRV